MNRIRCMLPLVLLALPSIVAAQSGAPAPKWELTFDFGIHSDRLVRPERFEPGPTPQAIAFTGPGEAPTAGVYATRWLSAHFGVDAGLALAHNASWQGVAPPEGKQTPLKLTLFSSIAPVLRVLPPASRVQLRLGVGPALITHTGTGTALLTRGSDFGVVGLADASVRLGHRLHFVVGARNYRFRSSFMNASFLDPVWSNLTSPAGNVSRSEWVYSSGFRLSF